MYVTNPSDAKLTNRQIFLVIFQRQPDLPEYLHRSPVKILRHRNRASESFGPLYCSAATNKYIAFYTMSESEIGSQKGSFPF